MKANKGAPYRGRLFFVLVVLVPLLSPVQSGNAQSAARPNIVVVMADDHAQWALGAYGLNQIDTPNIDWLADQGVLFENAMSPAPVCSPARASFYTGKMPSQHGVHDFLGESSEFDADWLSGEKLLSERLVDEGYRTGLFGKWHATTDSKAPQPGFNRWLSYDSLRAGWENQYLHSGTVNFSSDGEPLQYTGVQARFLTEEAIRFIDDPSPKPFFISLNFTEPHAPFVGLPERLVTRYRPIANDIVKAGGTSDMADRGSATTTPADHVEQLAQYLAAVSLIDDQVGRMLDALQGRQLLDDTLLVYTSDHGLLVGQYGLYGKTNATNPANFYEETVRIPLIVHAPGDRFRPSQARSELVDLMDLHATVIDYATGGRVSESEYGPGRSIRKLLEGERNTDWRTVQFSERGNARMVTDGRWKLVRSYPRDPQARPTDRWYDLAHPFGERHTAEAPRQPLRDRLITELERFFAKYETPGHTGRRIWDQPPPNARYRRDMEFTEQRK
ncbi:MAG: sulfatase [Gammaproteobacteria bacterium]|nr:MAG: sulfatase [Gammaproteobacteria bacterium]RLA34264.1 MAG: sulfatase [Gammaproteobacteria bacterium]